MPEIPTTAQEVYDSFESSFQDKSVIPNPLKLEWLKKAIARYSIELDPITYTIESITVGVNTENVLTFDDKLDKYVIDTLAVFMKQMYQERELSKVNKRVSIVGKDISIDGNNGSKTATKSELNYDDMKSSLMISNQKPTSYV